MSDSLAMELIHVTCGKCKQKTSFSMASLERERAPSCPYCGEPMHIDIEAAQKDALRQAQELDQSVDALGTME